MTRDLRRMMNPSTVAVIGGGAWCEDVIQQMQRMGFPGDIWPVHPAKPEICGLPAFKGVPDLPGAPDAAFVGINREATVGAVERLARAGAGGAVCFASGFAEVADGQGLHARLLKAAGEMPVLGPNCYGFINALDGFALWPDQHGCTQVKSGVAILTQSSNIAINLTMQSRGLPIASVITVGNQAQMSQAAIAQLLLDDPRITAIGVYVEGFGEVAEWEALARAAHTKNVPLVALKVGRSVEAQAVTISHTASMAGSDAASDALLRRLGIARVDDLAVFLETLKLAHVAGHLPSRNIATISCSGGEASLAADLAQAKGLHFPSLNDRQTGELSEALGPKVALSNPLDYHTYIWRDTEAMTRTFAAMPDPALALTMLIVDFPRADICDPSDWDCAVAAAKGAKAQTGQPLAMVATLPELMPEDVARDLMAAGIVPFNGLDAALTAVAVLQKAPLDALSLDVAQGRVGEGVTLSEAEAKAALARHGVPVPKSAEPGQATHLQAPLVLKGTGFAHKSEHGAVRLNLGHDDLAAAMAEMDAPGFLIEEMVQGGVAELLAGVTLDATCGYVLTLASGGVLTELWDDGVQLLLPTTDREIRQALGQLRTAPLLAGFRGKPAADPDAIVAAVLAMQAYVLANQGRVQEVEINPLIVTPEAAVAADALIRITDD